MKKTGEAYTAARSHLITKPKPRAKSADYAALAGMSDEKIKAKTGCTWERWVAALDREGANEMAHRHIVAIVNKKYKIDGWWSQTVTVGYERIKGLRARGQRRDGTYEAGKSRTFNVPVATLFDAWADASRRRKWLSADNVRVRTATSPKSIRLGWTDGSIIAVGFLPKGKSRSSVSLSHTKLPDRATANRLKAFWSEALDALGEVLTGT